MRILLAVALSLPAAAIAGKGAGPACQPVVERGWVRMAPGMPMAAGFAVLRNPCRAEAAIVGASSPAFADVSLHETRVEGGVSRMRAVPRIALPAGGTVELRPGGLHAMLMAMRRRRASASNSYWLMAGAWPPTSRCALPRPDQRRAQDARTASGNGAARPLVRSIQTITTLPSQ
jgi:copper(I)-binding protein